MKDEEITAAKKKGDPVHIPTVLGAVTVSYNVSGVDKGLKLDGATDRRHLPRQDHEVERPGDHRAQHRRQPARHRRSRSATAPTSRARRRTSRSSSPTTRKAWESGPGVDKSVKWPTGTGAKGNDGVAACVKQTDGAVGYVEQAYALQNNFTTAAVKNKAGNFVEPTLDGDVGRRRSGASRRRICASARSTRPGADAYPITAVTFLLVYQDMCKAGLDATKAGLAQGLAELRPRRRPGGRAGARVRAAAGRDQDHGPGQGRRPGRATAQRSRAEQRRWKQR